MKNTYVTLISLFLLSFALTANAQTEKPKPNKFAVASAEEMTEKARFRLYADYNYVMTNPSSLNDSRSRTLWSGTTPSRGTFGGMNGFMVGGSYLLGPGYLGIEYSFFSQELPNTLVTGGTLSVKDSFDSQTVFATYDLSYELSHDLSWDVGGGVGYAITYQYHNTFTQSGTTEEVIWQGNPILFKVRGFFNYHFSDNVRARVGAAYEYASTDNMTADTNHPTIGSGILSGQKLKDPKGASQVVDMSGLRLSAGIVVAF